MTKSQNAKTVTNKESLITSIAELSGLSKANSSRALDGMIESIQKSLKEGKTIKLSGFGVFSVSQRSAREGRNPKTGTKLKIPAAKYPKFRAGKNLKEIIA